MNSYPFFFILMPYIVKRRSEYPIPPGTHEVRISSISEEESKFEEGRLTTVIEFEKHENGLRKTLKISGSPSLHPEAKLSGLIEAVLNRPLTAMEAEAGFDLDTLKDKRVRVEVKDMPSRNGKLYPRVVKITPSEAKPL